MHYEPVIGLEVHAQLQTRSKMFCRCSTQYAGAEPNSHICPVCAGFPGVLPVLNEQAVELALSVGLALNCQIAPTSRFDRKSYPYPDLPKGYQISQYDLPLAIRGYMEVGTRDGGDERHIGIVRVHMEEDTAKSLHRRGHDGEAYSLVDFNRSGVPLLEIVSEPQIHSAAEAREYVSRLRQMLRYIDASTGNMEDGALRVDANVSVRPVGSTELGAKVEIKNMNSFRIVERALDYEIGRQITALEKGESVVQETRGWDEAAGVTLPQRTKEYASDYRYFPEPDLPPLTVDEVRSQDVLSRLAELPDTRRHRFAMQYGISDADAGVLTSSRETADYFEHVVAALDGRVPAKLAANWIINELFSLLKGSGPGAESQVTPALMADLLRMLHLGEVNPGTARTLLEEIHRTGRSPREVADKRGLTQISDTEKLRSVALAVIDGNPKAVEDYGKGKRQVVAFLIGQVMKETRGAAKADTVRELLESELASVGRS